MTGKLTHQDVQGGQWFTRFAKGVSMRSNDQIVGYEVDYTVSMKNEIIIFAFQFVHCIDLITLVTMLKQQKCPCCNM